MKKRSQKEKVLDWLQRGRTLTPLEALNLGMGMRLGAIIHVLRKEGHDIVDIGKEKYSEYKLMSKGGMLNF
tara:strand:+ start:100 stop:312 length:213 start_codon:yes stop_codon:yes gene_type:complete